MTGATIATQPALAFGPREPVRGSDVEYLTRAEQLRRRLVALMAERPEMAEWFRRAALADWYIGGRLSAKSLVERSRPVFRESIDNSLTPYLADWIEAECSDLEGKFERRRRPSAGKTVKELSE